MANTASDGANSMDGTVESPVVSVLLVDDDPDVRRLMNVMLGEERRFSVVGHARDGVEALLLANLSQPDVVVLDLQMPGMDGFTALPRLRACLPEARIVVISAFPDPYTLVEAVQRGADGYIDKSRLWAELLPTLRGLCDPEDPDADV